MFHAFNQSLYHANLAFKLSEKGLIVCVKMAWWDIISDILSDFIYFDEELIL